MGSITIIKTNGNLGREAAAQDGTSALVMNGVAVVGGAQLQTAYKLTSLADAEALGLTEAYDLANKVLVWHQIADFYFFAPTATPLYIFLVDQDYTLTQMSNKAVNNPITTASANILTMLTSAADHIKLLGFIRNPESPYAPTLEDGFNKDTLTAIPVAQALADTMATYMKPLSIIMDGRDLNGAYSAIVSMRALATKNPSVSVSCFQDKAVANKNALFAGHSAVGAVLGILAFAAVHENIGWTGKFQLSDPATGKFTALALSSGTLVKNILPADIATLETKGIIFGKYYPRQSQAYLNDSPTCTPETDDYAYIENNRVINKVITLAYDAMFPYINSPSPVDPNTGQIPIEYAKGYEATCERACTTMLRDGEISAVEFIVDPIQNVLATSKLLIKARVIPVGTNRHIEIVIGFSNPFNS